MNENLNEFITEKSLANLSTCAAMCAAVTEVFKIFFWCDPIIINFLVALVISAANLIVCNEKYDRKNITLAILNTVPIAFVANGLYDTIKYMFAR